MANVCAVRIVSCIQIRTQDTIHATQDLIQAQFYDDVANDPFDNIDDQSQSFYVVSVVDLEIVGEKKYE